LEQFLNVQSKEISALAEEARGSPDLVQRAMNFAMSRMLPADGPAVSKRIDGPPLRAD
jgi:hypothetical protein